MYKVRLQSFEGPFDLLVYLIETAEMSIYDIKISQITNQYLEYLQAMQERNIAVATEFMVLAASLIEIKSKMILPRVSQEETALTEEDPRTELVERLLEYKRFKQAAQLLAGKVDAIYVPIDSTVQSAMAQVVEAANKAGIPVYGSDPVMVKSGALACVSVSNTQLGERSAEMADQILKGKKVSEVPAEAMTTYQYVVSKSAAQTLGITIPQLDNLIIMGE